MKVGGTWAEIMAPGPCEVKIWRSHLEVKIICKEHGYDHPFMHASSLGNDVHEERCPPEFLHLVTPNSKNCNGLARPPGKPSAS